MRHFFTVVAAGALFLSAGRLHADDAVTIQRRDVAAGDVSLVQKTETTTVVMKVCEPGGKALVDRKQVTVVTASFRETVLVCDAKGPTKLERAYDKAQLTTDGQTTTLPYQGKTVLIEKHKGFYQFTMDGNKLTNSEAEPLVKEFSVGCDAKADLERAVATKVHVKLNDSWKLDLAPFIKDTINGGEMELDAERTKGTATLLKVYSAEGKPFAEVKAALTLPLRSLGKGVLKVVTQDGSVATVDLSLQGCIDGSCNTATIKSVTKVDAKTSLSLPDGSKAPMTLSVLAEAVESRKDVTKEVTRR